MSRELVLNYLTKAKRKRSLGQHFLVDEEVRDRLVCCVEEFKPKMVFEVGAGFGFITEGLSMIADKVLAVEKDPEIFEWASRSMKHLDNVELIRGDALLVDIPKDAVVTGALPYSISTSMMKKIVRSEVRNSIFILQKEYAEKIAAQAGGAQYSYLSALLGAFGSVELIEEVGKASFYPPPKVTSQIVGIRLEVKLSARGVEDLIRFLSDLFKKHRRRKVKNALKGFMKEEISEKRVFELKPQELFQLYLALRGEQMS